MSLRSKAGKSIPQGWPTKSPPIYLRAPAYSPRLAKTQLQTINSAPSSTHPGGVLIEFKSHIAPVSIQIITSPLHPAHAQRGLFATCALAPDTFILFYIGYVHNDLDNDPNSDYDLSMDRDAGLAIDATQMGNEARFVNDYRGVPGREDKGPNADFRDCWVRVGSGWERRVGVYVLPAGRSGKRKEGVKAGEELLVSYGKGFWCKARGDGGEQEG